MDVESIARRFVDAYNARELTAQTEQLFDPAVELVPLRAALEDTVYRGHDGIKTFARDLDESWAEVHAETFDFDTRGEQAVSTGRMRLTGRSSGAVTEVVRAAATIDW